jgi:hypothetical protein
MALRSVHPQRVNGHRTVRPWKSRSLNFPPRICPRCEKKYTPNRIFQGFCSIHCRRRAVSKIFPSTSCRLCKKQFKPKYKWQKFCSSDCRDTFHLHPKRRPFESLEDLKRRATKYQTKSLVARLKKHKKNKWCRSCPTPLMKNSKTWCEKHWFAQVVYRYGFKLAGWRRAKSLLKQQNYTCPYTGRKLVIGVNASLDHKNPRSRFPHLKNDWNNVEWVDLYINNIKQTLTKEEFKLRMRLLK